MSRRFKVSWAEVAAGDLERIALHVAEDQPAHAERVLARLEASAESLTHAPGRGRVVPELARFEVTSIRELIVAPWRIVYRVGQGTVLIVGVFDSRRDLERVLLARLLASS